MITWLRRAFAQLTAGLAAGVDVLTDLWPLVAIVVALALLGGCGTDPTEQKTPKSPTGAHAVPVPNDAAHLDRFCDGHNMVYVTYNDVIAVAASDLRCIK